jgi:hypothetical protein
LSQAEISAFRIGRKPVFYPSKHLKLAANLASATFGFVGQANAAGRSCPRIARYALAVTANIKSKLYAVF